MKHAIPMILVLALASCSTPTPTAAPTQNVAQMIASWNALNSACRGGSGDQPETLVACEQREALYPMIKAQGMCYGRPDEPMYMARWNPCTLG